MSGNYPDGCSQHDIDRAHDGSRADYYEEEAEAARRRDELEKQIVFDDLKDDDLPF